MGFYGTINNLPTSPPKNINCSIITELGILYQPLYHIKMVLPGVVRIHECNNVQFKELSDDSRDQTK